MSYKTTDLRYEGVKSSIDTMRNDEQVIRQILDEFNSTMTQTTNEDVFAGMASTALKDEFNSFKKTFDDFTNELHNFQNFYQSAAAQTQQTDQNLSKNI